MEAGAPPLRVRATIRLPAGLTAKVTAPDPTWKLGPGAAVSAPVTWLMANDVIVAAPLTAFAINRNFPSGERWISPPATPAAKGEPLTAVSEPSAAIVNAITLLLSGKVLSGLDTY